MTRPLVASMRAAVALTCSLALALPGSARASEPAPQEAAGPRTDELSPRAAEHVTRAYNNHESGSYALAEAEFQRAAFFAPRWRPLHFNLGVVAEAQGKLGAAIREYKEFRPYATADEAMLVDQRIVELDARRRKVAAVHHKQIAVGAVLLGVGLGMMAGGGVLAGINAKDPTLDNTGDDSRKKRITGGLVLALYGLLVAGLATVPLKRAVKSKRQLEGLALGRARLQLAAGGPRLRF